MPDDVTRTTSDLTVEQGLFERGFAGVVGMDEVGRGALAGPVTVGASWVPASATLEVPGLTDSKALTPSRREAMVPEILEWVQVATGSASPSEIDALGMTQALRLAGLRAIQALASRIGEPLVESSAVLLDGKHDWLTRVPDLLSLADPDPVDRLLNGSGRSWDLPVTMQIKGDDRCASIAAASVVAKVERDAEMIELASDHPAYGWTGNKGYGSEPHRKALSAQGPCPLHRLSWSLGASPDMVARAWALRG